MPETDTITMLETQEGGESAAASQDAVTPEAGSPGNDTAAAPETDATDLAKAFIETSESREPDMEVAEPDAAAKETPKEPADTVEKPDAGLSAFAERFGISIAQAPAAREALVGDFNRIIAAEGAGQPPADQPAGQTTQAQAPKTGTDSAPALPTGTATDDDSLSAIEDEFGPDSPAVQMFKQQAQQIKALTEQIGAASKASQQADAQRAIIEVVEPFFKELATDPRLAAVYGVKAPSKQQIQARMDILQKAAFYQQGKQREGISVSDADALRVAADAVHADIRVKDSKRVEQAERRHQSRDAAPANAGRTKELSPDASAKDLARAYLRGRA